jgi:hypothetical protein
MSAKATRQRDTNPGVDAMNNGMRLVESKESLAARIEAEAERDAAAIRRAGYFRIRPNLRRRDSRDRVRPRPAA